MNIQHTIAELKKLLAECARLGSEIADVTAAKKDLEAEGAKLFKELSDIVPHEKLILPPSDGDHFDEAVDRKLRTLHVVRAKLELLPAARAKRVRQIEPLESKILQLTPELLRGSREECRGRIEVLHTAILRVLLKVCVDEQCAKKAAKELTAGSKTMRLYKGLEMFTQDANPRIFCEQAVELVKRFMEDKSHTVVP